MKNPIAGVAPLLVLGMVPFAVQDKAPAGLNKIVAVVDLSRAEEGYPWHEQVKELLQQRWQETYQVRLKELSNKLEAAKLERATFRSGSAERRAHDFELQLLANELQQREKYFIGEMDRLRDGFVATIYREIRTAVKEIATKRGIALVLRAREAEGAPQGDLDGIEISQRDVLFFEPALDITKDVVDLMRLKPPARPTLDSLKDAAREAGRAGAGKDQAKDPAKDQKDDGKPGTTKQNGGAADAASRNRADDKK